MVKSFRHNSGDKQFFCNRQSTGLFLFLKSELIVLFTQEYRNPKFINIFDCFCIYGSNN